MESLLLRSIESLQTRLAAVPDCEIGGKIALQISHEISELIDQLIIVRR